MELKKSMPPRGVMVRVLFSILFLLLFENICLGGQWTMLFYMAADNDLYPQALIDINELQRVSGQPGTDILVQLDSPSGAFRYRVLPQGLSVLAGLGDVNSGSGKTLADFGIWAVKAFPASKYLLVLWDHGDGWSKRGKFIGLDHNRFLNVAGGELRDALAKIVSAAGQPLDVVVFDACSMQMAEVLLELDGLSRYAVGSEAAFPVQGMPYEQAWEKINGDTPAESLAVRLVSSCQSFDNQGYQTTCSAVNIGELKLAAQNIRALAGRFSALPETFLVDLEGIPDSVLGFPPMSSYDLPGILDFIGTRLPDPEKAMFQEAGEQIKKSVLIQTVTGDQYQKARGLAVWYPNGKYNFEGGIDPYTSLNWQGLSRWDKMLYRLIFDQDDQAEVPQNIILTRYSNGIWELGWESGYDPSGVGSFQVRQSQDLLISFLDQSGAGNASRWNKTGFTTVAGDHGDTSYYSIGGQMTGNDTITFDSSGSVAFSAEGSWGSLILESTVDASENWDTLGVWNFYGADTVKYCSAKTSSAQGRLRIGWMPFSAGFVYVDDITVCYPDPAKTIQITPSRLPACKLTRQPGAGGYYQVRTIDSLNNSSSWSEAVRYSPETGSVKAWPNPFKDDFMLAFSLESGQTVDVKIYNVLGQYVSGMTLRQKTTSGSNTDYLYHWAPQKSLASGIYLVRINTGRVARAVKMIFIR